MTKNISGAKKVLTIEGNAVLSLVKRVDKNFDKVINFLAKLKGRVIVTGMGKPGFIAQKISATLSSTGTPSLYLHPAEALHGDLGRVREEDALIAFSNSGETEEIVRLLPIVKKIGSSLIAEEAIRYSKFSDKTWIRASKEFRNNFLDYNNINLTNL